MPADPVAAGRKGGSRNTPAQQDARRKNGFQRQKPAPTPHPETEQRQVPVLIIPREDQ
jgi:hypothetical protein